jgi:cell division protein FtsI/penicillin-binding protein 2
MEASESHNKRIVRIAISFAVLILGLMSATLFKITSLKVSPPAELIAVSTTLNSTTRQLAKRGQLLDRRGRILAASRVGHRLFVDPELMLIDKEDIESLSLQLGELLGVSPANIEQKIRSRQTSKYVVVHPLLDPSQLEAIRALNIRSIGVEQCLVREYPHGDIGGALVGLVGTEHTGLAGFENSYDTVLTGESGTFIRLRDIGKRTLWVSPKDFTPTLDGSDVRLSIDVVIQDIATNYLMKEIKRCNAGGGRIVVVDPSTGEILAMADIIHPRDGWSQQPSDPYREINPRLGRNRCVTDPYEPGSTFKPFIWSVATELGKATINEVLPTPSAGPYITSYNRPIRDAHYSGPSTWRTVLVKSLNSGMAIVAERLTHEQMRDAVSRFGFGETTHIGLGGESRGIVTAPSNWDNNTQTSVSMGHEIAVTPLQMIQGFCAFARDGTIPQLQMTVSEPTDVQIVRHAVSPEIAALTRKILGEVMTEGTGRRANSDRYTLFGKSGTAQLPRDDGKGYFEDRYVSSFIGGAPIDNPSIVVLCVIDDPDKSIDHFGGVVAGPVVRDVIVDTLQYLGVPPTNEFLARVE